ncbi:unnamed protein product [Urochloa humidicola]
MTPLQVMDKKKERWWERIVDRYNSKRGEHPMRSLRSVQSRWEVIKNEVGRFAGYYADAFRENPSGMSDADKTTLAASNFAAICKHNFAFMHCWNLMKDEPKWQDPKSRSVANTAVGAGFADDPINLGDEVGTPSAEAGNRPMGRDAAKAAKKKANSSAGSSSSSEYASRMQDLSLQRISILQAEAIKKNDRFQQLASIDEKRYDDIGYLPNVYEVSIIGIFLFILHNHVMQNDASYHDIIKLGTIPTISGSSDNCKPLL